VKKNEMRVVDSNFDRMQARQGLRAKNQSQMSKIIPMLQVGTKATPDHDQTIAGLEKRIADLREMGSVLTTAFQKLWTAHKVSQERQMKRLTVALLALEEQRKLRRMQGTTKYVRAASNELTGTREALFVDGLDIDPQNLMSCKTLLKKLDELAAQTAKKVNQAMLERETDPDADSESSEMSRDPVFADDVADVIRATNEQAKAIPSFEDKPFVVARIPVIPVAKTSLSIDRLRSRGFVVASLGGYPVINNQLVIGINGKDVEGTEAERQAGKTIPRHRWAAAAQAVVERIEAETKVRMAFVDDRPHGHAGGAWFWLMPESELDNFAASFSGQSLQLRSWGFGTSKRDA
jgi:hypothetical protein